MLRIVIACIVGISASAAFEASEWATPATAREDGLHVSSRGVIQTLLEDIRPACEFTPTMEAKDFPAWQARLRGAMQELMKHPQAKEQAYELAGAPDAFRYHHQPKFAQAQRWNGTHLPHGLDRNAFFNLVNVDPKNHFFKKDLVLPWLRHLLATPALK